MATDPLALQKILDDCRVWAETKVFQAALAEHSGSINDWDSIQELKPKEVVVLLMDMWATLYSYYALISDPDKNEMTTPWPENIKAIKITYLDLTKKIEEELCHQIINMGADPNQAMESTYYHFIIKKFNEMPVFKTHKMAEVIRFLKSQKETYVDQLGSSLIESTQTFSAETDLKTLALTIQSIYDLMTSDDCSVDLFEQLKGYSSYVIGMFCDRIISKKENAESLLTAIENLGYPLQIFLEIFEDLIKKNKYDDANKLMGTLLSVVLTPTGLKKIENLEDKSPLPSEKTIQRMFMLLALWNMTSDPTKAFGLSKGESLAYELFMKPIKSLIREGLNDFLKTLTLEDLKAYTREKTTFLAELIDQKSGISFGDTTTRKNVTALIKEKSLVSAAVAPGGPGFMPATKGGQPAVQATTKLELPRK